MSSMTRSLSSSVSSRKGGEYPPDDLDARDSDWRRLSASCDERALVAAAVEVHAGAGLRRALAVAGHQLGAVDRARRRGRARASPTRAAGRRARRASTRARRRGSRRPPGTPSRGARRRRDVPAAPGGDHVVDPIQRAVVVGQRERDAQDRHLGGVDGPSRGGALDRVGAPLPERGLLAAGWLGQGRFRDRLLRSDTLASSLLALTRSGEKSFAVGPVTAFIPPLCRYPVIRCGIHSIAG